MKSQLAESLIRSVSAKYRAIDTTLKKQYYTYTDVDGNTARYRKDLNWLQHPVVYRRPQADLVRGRDWSFVNDKKRRAPPFYRYAYRTYKSKVCGKRL